MCPCLLCSNRWVGRGRRTQGIAGLWWLVGVHLHHEGADNIHGGDTLGLIRHVQVMVLPGRRHGVACIFRSRYCPGRSSGVFGPHASRDLFHVTEVALHSAILDNGVVSHQCAHSDTVYEHFEI